ncbi:MAG: hypothetical protein L7F78_25815, partial [Syntrophales bacterium LBB04]|nr:hypothetical protein [Syntrophales bacterium LBB04]
MKAFLLNVTVTTAGILGSWLMRFIAWWIATGYFFLRPSRLIASLHLYEAIFPHRGRCYHLCCAWRQFHSLAASYTDRIGLDGKTGGGVS